VDCALAIQLHPKVTRWVRNIERLPTSFRLRVSNQWFYPDLVAQLNDGGIVVVEYKGKGTEGPADRTEEKEAVGKKWAAVSGNRFVMAKDRDYGAVARAIGG
jgi:type III restriction enzyme